APTATIQPPQGKTEADMLAGLNEQLEQEPPTHGQRIRSAVEGLSTVLLLPEFAEADSAALAELPESKLKALRDDLISANAIVKAGQMFAEATPDGAGEGEENEEDREEVVQEPVV